MTVLAFGQTGQVGTALGRLPDVKCVGRDAADLSDPDAIAALIHAHKPHAVINAAAYTAVDQAEQDEARALLINATAPQAMAQACADLDIPFVHISTDYVFAGQGNAPASPDTPTDPQNAYGRSKRAGEVGISAIGGRFAILRTSWVFSADGANFVKTMLRLARTRTSLNIVNDQIGGPTSARAIAQACYGMADALAHDGSKSGIYHFSGAPDVSWYDFAREIFTQARCDVQITGIGTRDYPTPAVRPLNSRLDCSQTNSVFGIMRPDWRRDLHDVLQELDPQI